MLFSPHNCAAISPRLALDHFIHFYIISIHPVCSICSFFSHVLHLSIPTLFQQVFFFLFPDSIFFVG
ncbi:hypothetical protein BC829DRAFT_382131 [Chytridium lagenaria]|nr:hypothetical protein BC829DRAFT_382131 [Chytridium lagenaria]